MDKKTTDGMVLISEPSLRRGPNEGSETGGKGLPHARGDVS